MCGGWGAAKGVCGIERRGEDFYYLVSTLDSRVIACMYKYIDECMCICMGVLASPTCRKAELVHAQ